MSISSQITRHRSLLACRLLFGLILTSPFWSSPGVYAASLSGGAAPAFTQTSQDAWINSEPLTWAALRGRVVLVDFWTFDCWNCYRSFPWLKDLEARYSDRGLKVIGIHTPEFEHERIRSNIERKVEEFGLAHPIMIDNDFAYWKAMNNRYWPAYYLVDKRGHLRALHVGETHRDTPRADRIETEILGLLDEPA